MQTDGISVSTKPGKDWLAVPFGIASLPNYVSMLPSQEASALLKPEGATLRNYDELERLAIQQSGTVQYRKRHNRMTNAFGRMFGEQRPQQGSGANMYDVRLCNYDGKGRDLLIEAKPDPDKGSLRIAIGQLYDYRRVLKNRSATHLAVLTIGKPEQAYVDLLVKDLGIGILWFIDENCDGLEGEGSGWPSLKRLLR